MKRRKKKSGRNTRIGDKISLLRHEGKSEKAAVGEAEGMERSGRLKRHGKYMHKRSRRKGHR